LLGQAVAFFAIFCALVLLPGVVLGWSVASKWLDLQQEMLQLEREKVRLLTEQAKESGEREDRPGLSAASGDLPAPRGPST
jgi:hypothetical protein